MPTLYVTILQYTKSNKKEKDLTIYKNKTMQQVNEAQKVIESLYHLDASDLDTVIELATSLYDEKIESMPTEISPSYELSVAESSMLFAMQ